MDPKNIINRFIDEVLNKKNIGAIDQIVAEDFLEHVPFPGQGPGRAGLRDAVTAFIAAFPDMQWRVDQQITEGNTVVTRFTLTGTHQGDFMGTPPTGRSIDVWGVVIDGVRDGLFAESRILLDSATLMRQLTA